MEMDSSWAREAETLTISSEVSVPVSIFSFSNLTVTYKALVFCGGNAGDPDLADMHCGIDLENAWVWDVIKAWFATAYTFFK